MTDAPQGLSENQQKLMDDFLQRAALGIERAHFAEKAQEEQLLQETDKLQKALLDSVSHSLRTPLTSIIGAVGGLLKSSAVSNQAIVREYLEPAYEEAVHLNRLVDNLLDMARLEAGAVSATRELCDISEVIGNAIGRIGGETRRQRISMEVPPNVPMISMDYILIADVMVNLLDNALKYSPPDSPIKIEARLKSGQLEVRVMDRGPGIPEEHLESIFEKFRRGSQGQGLGLGLSICKGFVEVHGGHIWAERRAQGGTAFVFTLPIRQLEAPKSAAGPRMAECDVKIG
jgi:two-component system sensor histidine kinase KdpD